MKYINGMLEIDHPSGEAVWRDRNSRSARVLGLACGCSSLMGEASETRTGWMRFDIAVLRWLLPSKNTDVLGIHH